MTSKFKVGDKVRCIEVYDHHETPPVAGVEYTVERIEAGFILELLSLEGVRGGHYAYRFELVEPATPEFKVGDRVAVAFEGVIASVYGYTAFFDSGINTLAAPLSSLTKLTDPIPTADGAVIRFTDGDVSTRIVGRWSTTGSYERTSDEDMQSDADRYGFTVLYAGDES